MLKRKQKRWKQWELDAAQIKKVESVVKKLCKAIGPGIYTLCVIYDEKTREALKHPRDEKYGWKKLMHRRTASIR